MKIEEAMQLALAALKSVETSPTDIRLSEAELEAEGRFWYVTFRYQLLTWELLYKIPLLPPIRKVKKQTQEFKIFIVNTGTHQVEAISTFSEPQSEFVCIEEN
jgi:hypothetical protein